MKTLKFSVIFIIVLLCILQEVVTKSSQNVVIDNISDMKELKKLFRTKTNMLVMFVASIKESQPTIKIFRDAAEIVKGSGTMVLIDCSNNDKKKICKKLKVAPSPIILKHYKDGDFHKDYDRQLTISSIVNFMRDPTGDLPWEEDPAGADVFHISDTTVGQCMAAFGCDYMVFQFQSLSKIIKKESKPILVMFYAPWCGYCKQLKPEFSAAATESKAKYIFAAIDVDRPENTMARRQYNITGFPTLLYFESGKMKYTYDGENKRASLISFMENPSAPSPSKSKEDDWSADTTSEIVHLTTNGFEPALKDEKSVLVMFYAPWCGHCKRMKPEYEKAADIMKNEKIPGVLAALDATKESAIAQKYGVKGYPTVKYFVNGEFMFDVNVRDADKIIAFMKDPKEPPPPPPPEKPWDEEETEVVHLTDQDFKTFLKKKKHALVMFYAPWCGHCKKAKPEFSAAALAFKEDPRVALVAVDCTKHSTVCSAYGVHGYPTIKYFSYLKTQIDYTGGRTKDEFVEFLQSPESPHSRGGSENLEPFVNIPGGENILILNDENFDKEIHAYKRVLVMFYAPWCGHCNAMKPDFAAAGTQLAGDANMRVAAVDCDANQKLAGKYKIQGFPTIMLFENGNPEIDYEGPRKTDNLVKFIKSYKKKDEL